MTFRLALALIPLALSACDPAMMNGTTSTGFIEELPEEVMTIAGPYQNLSAVRINPEDGCYEYQHVGPVETTFLPLRSKNGRPICTRAPEEAAAA